MNNARHKYMQFLGISNIFQQIFPEEETSATISIKNGESIFNVQNVTCRPGNQYQVKT